MDLIVSSDDFVPKSIDSTLLLQQDQNLDELQGTSSSENSNSGENTGRWTAEEHRLFLQGLEQHGKGWKKIASLIKSRTVVQIRTHAQKYFQKLAKSKQGGGDDTEHGGGVGGGAGSSSGHHSSTHAGRHVGTSSGGTVRLLANGDAASTSQDNKRRRNLLSGTKRKAISSVVASALRDRKKTVTKQSVDSDLIHHGIAPTLVPFVKMTRISSSSSEDTSITTLSSSVLEESL